MTPTRSLTLLALASALFLVGCRSQPTPADFTGAWTGQASVINASGSGKSMQYWDLVADPSGRMTGNASYKISEDQAITGTSAEGKVVKSDSETVMGMIDYDTGKFILVETEENGTVFGELLPDGRIKLIRSQPGQNPVVIRTILSRQAR